LEKSGDSDKRKLSAVHYKINHGRDFFKFVGAGERTPDSFLPDYTGEPPESPWKVSRIC